MPLQWSGSGKTQLYGTSHLKQIYAELQERKIPLGKCDRYAGVAPQSEYRVATDSFDGSNKFLQHSQVNIYTDGSKSDTGTGAGVVILQKGYPETKLRFYMPDTSTVFMAEIEAIKQAAQFIIENARTREMRFVKLFSDSRSSLQALDGYQTKSKNVVQTMNALNGASNVVKKITLVWVKAHSGRPGNELADQTAKEAATDHPEEVSCSPQKLPMSFYKTLLYNTSAEIRLTDWLSYKKATSLKPFTSQTSKKRSKELLELDRSGLSVLLGLLTGHNELRYFAAKTNPTMPEYCRLCKNADETFLHLLINCIGTREGRVAVFGQSNLPSDVTNLWTVDKLMEFISITPIAKLALGRISDRCLFSDSSDTKSNTNTPEGQCVPSSSYTSTSSST